MYWSSLFVCLPLWYINVRVALAQMSQRCFSRVFILEAQTLKHNLWSCNLWHNLNCFTSLSFYHSHCSQQNFFSVFLFCFQLYLRAVYWFLYSTSICNRSLYSILCKVMSFFRNVACSNILCILLNVQRQWVLKSMLCVCTMLGSGFISTTISFQE